MKVKDIVKNIKTLLAVDINLKAFKTTDGLILECKDLVEGEIVYEVSEDGSVPVGEGEYTLEDGTILACGPDGVITAITMGEPEEPVEPPQQPAIPLPVEEEELSVQIGNIRTELDALKAEHLEVLKTLEILSQSLSDKLFKSEVKQSLKKEKEVVVVEPVVQESTFTSNKNIMRPDFMRMLKKVGEITNKK